MKNKSMNEWIALEAAYAASAALCVTDKAGVQRRPQPKPPLTDFDIQPYSRTYSA